MFWDGLCVGIQVIPCHAYAATPAATTTDAVDADDDNETWRGLCYVDAIVCGVCEWWIFGDSSVVYC